MPRPEDIGLQIRSRRLAQGLTLEALAEASGVSTTMLSEVERTLKNPTVKLAYRIARALGCSLTQLLEEDPGPQATLVRAKERPVLIDPESAVERYSLSRELLRRGVELAWYVLPPGTGTGEMPPNRAGILEHVSVLAGNLVLRLGSESHRLARGDGLTYGPQVAVEYKNEGRKPCEFLMVSDSTRAL